VWLLGRSFNEARDRLEERPTAARRRLGCRSSRSNDRPRATRERLRGGPAPKPTADRRPGALDAAAGLGFLARMPGGATVGIEAVAGQPGGPAFNGSGRFIGFAASTGAAVAPIVNIERLTDSPGATMPKADSGNTPADASRRRNSSC